MRLIDADALIEQMEADAEYIEEMLFKMAAYAAINDVKHQPTIDPQKWIPCSERLPDKDHICLVCGKKGGMCVARFWTDGKTNLWTKTGTGKFVYPIAWMPLPEPYKGEQT